MGLLVLTDRVREHRGARAGARGVAPRRNRRAAGARRHADADRPSADCREPRARRAGRGARCPARAARDPGARRVRRALAAPRRIFFNVGVDGLVIGFAALVACGSALVFGFVPALQSSRVDLVSVINEDASPRGAVARTTARRSRHRAGGGVAAAAGRRRARDAQPRGGAARESRLRCQPRDGDRGRRQTERDTTSRAAACSIASCWTPPAPTPASNRPRSRRTSRWRFSIRRRDASRSRATSRVEAKIWRSCRTPSARTTSARCGSISPPGGSSKTETMRQAAPVAIVNDTLAQRFWGGAANAIGKRVRVGDGEWRTVIGVAADVKYVRINELAAPVFLRAVPAVVPVEHDPAHAGRRAGRRARGPGARACCRARPGSADSVTPGRWPTRCAAR